MALNLEIESSKGKVKPNRFGLGVFVCIFNKDFSKMLLLKRNNEKRLKYGRDWGNVGGRVELGERIIDSCIREIKEEIDLSISEDKLKLIKIKETPDYYNEVHALHFFYAMIIDKNKKLTLNDESDGYEWFNVKDLPDKTLDSKEHLLEFKELAMKVFT